MGEALKEAYTEPGTWLIPLNSTVSHLEGIKAVSDYLEQKGWGKGNHQLQVARLADFPPALLGRAHPHGLLREMRHCPGAGKRPAR